MKTSKVILGGCWYSRIKYCRPDARDGLVPNANDKGVGLRLVEQLATIRQNYHNSEQFDLQGTELNLPGEHTLAEHYFLIAG